ncbi:flagellar basal body L-ring protein FlgH [uncultured Kushneria sp.]|uniref:flagellar basal body L-ring protein FlgH n=1 Tax=uncultured Kushneria sp. TaxID=905033 RepID=UPI0026187DC3|nr:flagellar basal body L-ring protein FlgH [uncultured Kushneria sp.]
MRYMRLWKLFLVACLAMTMVACAQIPRQNVVEGPTTAPPQLPPIPVANGSIYQSNYTRPLFEDRRPRGVGDILTIVLNENVSATKSSAANATRNGSTALGLEATPRVIGGLLDGQTTSLSGTNTFQGQGGANASNTFTGTITTTVMNVLPNGNFQVAGEKRIGINQGTEYIRFSGTVNPRTITGLNTVPSTQVADARLEYYGDGYINEAQTMGWMQRFFLNISPF